MKTVLLFDFQVNKETNSVAVTREFAAGIDLVWAAWTQPELMDKWWAPKPYQTHTKFMDFRVGGYWLYAMVGPEGDTHWCRCDYDHIETLKSYSGQDGFCDEDGTINKELPQSKWLTGFARQDTHTIVSITLSYNQLSELETIIQMGFKEGFTMALENLDALLTEMADKA